VERGTVIFNTSSQDNQYINFILPATVAANCWLFSAENGVYGIIGFPSQIFPKFPVFLQFPIVLLSGFSEPCWSVKDVELGPSAKLACKHAPDAVS